MAKGDLNSVQSNAAAWMARATANANRIEGIAEPGYADFARTGGVTPQEESLARRETSYGIGNLYSAMQRNLERKKAVQGGYSPGFGAQQAQLGRQGAEQVARGITGTNLGLLQQRREGRLAGLGGLSRMAAINEGNIPAFMGIKSDAAARQKDWWNNASGIMSTIGQGASFFA